MQKCRPHRVNSRVIRKIYIYVKLERLIGITHA